MKNKIELIHRDYQEYTELINNKKKWLEPDYLDKQYTHYSQPHTQEYHNPIGAPLFLVTIKKLEWLNMFPLIFVRDGITSIAHFFYKHPTPKNIISTLAIPKEAESVIPEAWIDHCITYSTKRFKRDDIAPRDNIVLVSSISENLYCLKELKEKFCEIKNKFRLPVSAIVFDNIKLGEEFRMDYNLHNADFYRTLFEIFGSDFTINNWFSSKDVDYSNSYFYETHKNNLNFSDSFVTHLFLSQGAQPLNNRYIEDDFEDNCKRISRYHFLKFEVATLNKESNKLWSFIKTSEDLLLSGEKLLNRSMQDFEKISLCTPEFENIIKDYINDKTL